MTSKSDVYSDEEHKRKSNAFIIEIAGLRIRDNRRDQAKRPGESRTPKIVDNFSKPFHFSIRNKKQTLLKEHR
jgi:hypothetical protein